MLTTSHGVVLPALNEVTAEKRAQLHYLRPKLLLELPHERGIYLLHWFERELLVDASRHRLAHPAGYHKLDRSFQRPEPGLPVREIIHKPLHPLRPQRLSFVVYTIFDGRLTVGSDEVHH